MKLIVGLGNPGIKYEQTRHNIGFMAVEELARKWEKGEVRWKEDSKIKVYTLHPNPHTLLVKPLTFMNNCGWAVKSLVDACHVELAETWVIHDDLDLPLGKIKIRVGGGTAGHHGLESIVEHLGTTDFVRFRLGIGKPQGHDEWEKINVKRKEIENYVLSEFLPREQGEVRKMIKKTVAAIQFALKFGLEKSMNRFNQ